MSRFAPQARFAPFSPINKRNVDLMLKMTSREADWIILSRIYQ
jgi:hypothetical protein